MPNALVLNNIHKTYDTGTKALNGTSFAVEEGEMFALLGANGAGKTTLIGILCGLIAKTSGTAEVFGVNIDEHPEDARRLIGVVPQEFNFNIFERVIDIVVDAAGYYGIPRSVAIPRTENILKDLGLWDKRDSVARTLSGGMKRRLLIARALVHQPKLLLLDEPSAGVDVELRGEMWEFIVRLNQHGTTVILTTHYLEEAERLCKRVVILKNGAVAKEGTIASLVAESNSKSLEDFYLNV